MNVINNHHYHKKLIITIGELYWITDDLMDISSDLKQNRLNSILLSIDHKMGHTYDSYQKYDILSKLLSGNYFLTACNGICYRIHSVLTSLQSFDTKEEDVQEIRQVIISTIRDWIE